MVNPRIPGRAGRVLTSFWSTIACSEMTFRPCQHCGKDIRDLAPTDLESFDAVVHLAAISNDPLGDLNPDCTYDINHVGSMHLAKLAKQAGVDRFLFSSSCSTYGAGC